MLWCSLDNELITLPISHYGGLAEWLMHLTMEVRVPGRSLPGVPFQFLSQYFLFDCFSHLLQSNG